MTHTLDISPDDFMAIKAGKKTTLSLPDGWMYQVNDVLALAPHDGAFYVFDGDYLIRKITAVVNIPPSIAPSCSVKITLDFM